MKEWIPCVAMKQAAFHAMAEFYQSVVAQKAKSYGEQIARLRVRQCLYHVPTKFLAQIHSLLKDSWIELIKKS